MPAAKTLPRRQGAGLLGRTTRASTGRFKLYVASMEELLNPGKRMPKIARFDQDVRIALGPRTWRRHGRRSRSLGFDAWSSRPAPASAAWQASSTRRSSTTWSLAKLQPDELDARLVKQLGETEGKKVAAELQRGRRRDREGPRAPGRRDPHAIRSWSEIYSSCTAEVENEGHRFGEDLPDADKKALIAFLATL